MPPVESLFSKKLRYKEFAKVFVDTFDPIAAGKAGEIKNPVREFATNEVLQEIVEKEFGEMVNIYNSIPVAALKMELFKIAMSEKSSPTQKTAAIKELKSSDWNILEDKADTMGGLMSSTKKAVEKNKKKK